MRVEASLQRAKQGKFGYGRGGQMQTARSTTSRSNQPLVPIRKRQTPYGISARTRSSLYPYTERCVRLGGTYQAFSLFTSALSKAYFCEAIEGSKSIRG